MIVKKHLFADDGTSTVWGAPSPAGQSNLNNHSKYNKKVNNTKDTVRTISPATTFCLLPTQPGRKVNFINFLFNFYKSLVRNWKFLQSIHL